MPYLVSYGSPSPGPRANYRLPAGLEARCWNGHTARTDGTENAWIPGPETWRTADTQPTFVYPCPGAGCSELVTFTCELADLGDPVT